jgi:hypothetical protein
VIAVAMVVALGTLGAWSILATLELAARDGLRQVPVDPDRLGAR